jgi:superfamily I DNA/RNA helicase
MTFVPSPEQQAIFDAVLNTRDNIAISAYAGTGKCVLPQTLISAGGTLIPAETLFATMKRSEPFPDADGGIWYKILEPIYTDSLDSSGAFVRKPITHAYKQFVRETIRIIRLNDGSIIHLTKAHKLYDGLQWTNDFSEGDVISVPGQLSEGTVEFDPIVASFFGWLIGEGYDTPRNSSANFAFTMRDEETLQHIKSLLDQIEDKYNLPVREKNIIKHSSRNVFVFRLASKELRTFLEGFGYKIGDKSRDKQIPHSLMNASNEAVVAFLKSFFDGEGFADASRGYVTATTASLLLAKQVIYLLRRFGIWARLRTTQKSATNGHNIRRTYYDINISGASVRVFRDLVGFGVVAYKIERLNKICLKSQNTNIDTIPSYRVLNVLSESGLGHMAINVTDTDYLHRKSLSRDLYFQRVRPSLLSIEIGRTYPANQFRPKVIVTPALQKQIHETVAHLDKLAEQHLKYATIKSIEEVEYEGWVYDFTVEDTHNFVAENILCHNTTTLVQLAKKLPTTGSKIYVAFNKDSVSDVQPKLDGTGMTAKTFHSLGYGALAKHLSAGRLEPDDSKYKKLVQAWAESSSELSMTIDMLVKEEELEEGVDKRKKELFKGTVSMLVDLLRYMRLKLIEWDDLEGLRGLVQLYRLDDDIDYYYELVGIAVQAVSGIMKQSEKALRDKIELDFTDMIYWVVRWDLQIYQYMYVFVDEAQDLSPMQRAMIKKAIFEKGGRIVLVGDKNQAIYAFAGADSDSFDLSVNMFNAHVLPLSVTRRSDQIIVQHAKRLVSDFSALAESKRGKIVWIDEGRLTALAQPGDMVISRVKAPLVSACIDFIANGKPATILGNDIGKALIRIVERLTEKDGFTWSKVEDFLDKYEEEQVKKLLAKEDESGAEAVRDQCSAVSVVLEKAQAIDFDSFTAYVNRLFSSKEKDGVIILCTAHKSKGLEADRVFLLSPDKLPLLFPDQTPEQRQQEYNLEYVAITRAKHCLVYLTNKKFLDRNSQPPYVQTTFDDLNWSEPVKPQVVITPEEEYAQNEEALNDLDDDLDEIPETGPDFLTRLSHEPEYDDDDLEEEEEFDFIPTPLTAEPPPYVPALWGPMDEEIEDPLLGLFEEDDEPEPVRLYVQPKGDSSVQVILPAPSVISKLKRAMIGFDAADYRDTEIWAAAADYLDIQRHEPIEYPYTIEERYGVPFGSDWMPAPAPSVTPVTPAFRASRELSTDLKTFSVVKTKERLMLMIGDMSEADLKRAAQLLDKEFKSKEAPAASQPSLL